MGWEGYEGAMGVKMFSRLHGVSRMGCHQGGSGKGRLDEPHRQESGLTWDFCLSSGITSCRENVQKARMF